MAQEFTFTVNGVEHTTTQNKPLLRYLRDDLHIHSAKDGCSEGACGTCTIHVDGAAVKACVLTTALAAGRNIVTVEGLPEDVREAFVYAFGAVGAVQCGFCIPGMVMAGAALIAEDPEPTEEQIKYAIRGNVCRCTGYKKIIEGISLAAAVLRGEKQIDEDLERGDDYGVGKRAFRIDVRKKVLGEGKYPDDIDELDQPGLTYASAVRSKYPRARVLSIDTSKAEALPGVVGILRAEDVPVNQVGHLIQDWDVMMPSCWWLPRTRRRSRRPRSSSRLITSLWNPCVTSPRPGLPTLRACTTASLPLATRWSSRTTYARAVT